MRNLLWMASLIILFGPNPVRSQDAALPDTAGWSQELAAFADLGPQSRQERQSRARALVNARLDRSHTKRESPGPYITLIRTCFHQARSHTFSFNTLLGKKVDFLGPALADLETALELDPTLNPARIALGAAWVEVGLPVRGVAHLMRAKALLDAAADPGDPNWPHLRDHCLHGLAYGLLQCGLWDECGEVLAEAADHGHSPTGDTLEGLRLARGGRTTEALHYAVTMPPVSFRHQTALSSGMYPRPSSYANRWIKSQALLTAGDPQGARHVLGELASLRRRPLPLARDFWQDAGLVCEVLRDPTALEHYKMAAAYSFIAWFCTPTAYLPGPVVLGYPDPDLPVYVSPQGGFFGGSPFAYLALQLSRASEDPHADSGQEAARLGSELCTILLRRNILPAVVHSFRGQIMAAVGRTGQSHADLLAAWQGFTADGELDAGTWLLLGLQEIQRENKDQGLGLIREVTEAEPGNARAWRTLGIAWSTVGAADKAQQAMDRALALEPASLEGWFNAGVLAFRNRAFDQALSCLEKAWQLDPGNERVQHMLQTVANARRQASREATTTGR